MMILRHLTAPLAVVALAAGGLALTTGSSSAALIGCPASFTQDGIAKVHDGSGGKLSAASACQYDDQTDQSDVAVEATINTSGFFGHSDWSFNANNTNVDNDQGAGAQSGTWQINNVDFANKDYMITFKDGRGTHLVSFLFDESVASGGWDTPFTAPPFTLPGNSTSADVSHFAIFERDTLNGGTPGIPLPQTLGLLGAGLIGLGWAARRKRRA